VPGYLSHLAARSAGSRSGLRPRIASLFESAPATGVARDAQPGGLRVIDQERVVVQPPALSPVAAAPTAQAVHAAPTAPAAAASESRPAPPPHRQRVEPVEEAAPRPSPPPLRLKPRGETAAPKEVQPLVSERISLRRTRTAAPQEESPRLALRPAQLPAEPPPNSTVEARAEPPLRPPARMRPEEIRAQPVQPSPERAAPPATATLLAPPLVPQPEMRPVQRFPAFAEPNKHEPPSVQVTIGRLIVEAVVPVPAAAPLAAARQPVPRLSLDDYLRQRRSQA